MKDRGKRPWRILRLEQLECREVLTAAVFTPLDALAAPPDSPPAQSPEAPVENHASDELAASQHKVGAGDWRHFPSNRSVAVGDFNGDRAFDLAYVRFDGRMLSVDIVYDAGDDADNLADNLSIQADKTSLVDRANKSAEARDRSAEARNDAETQDFVTRSHHTADALVAATFQVRSFELDLAESTERSDNLAIKRVTAGDFNGDGVAELAVLIRDPHSGDSRVIVFESSAEGPTPVAAQVVEFTSSDDDDLMVVREASDEFDNLRVGERRVARGSWQGLDLSDLLAEVEPAEAEPAEAEPGELTNAAFFVHASLAVDVPADVAAAAPEVEVPAEALPEAGADRPPAIASAAAVAVDAIFADQPLTVPEPQLWLGNTGETSTESESSTPPTTPRGAVVAATAVTVAPSATRTLSEAQIGELIADKQEVGLQALLQQFGGKFESYVRKRFNRRWTKDEIEDILTEAAYRVWKYFDPSRGVSAGGFLMVTGDSAARDWLRKLRPLVSLEDLNEASLPRTASRAEQTDTKAAVHQAIAELSDMEQGIVRADLLAGGKAKNRELAAGLGVSSSAISHARSRAYAKLREKLADFGPHPSS